MNNKECGSTTVNYLVVASFLVIVGATAIPEFANQTSLKFCTAGFSIETLETNRNQDFSNISYTNGNCSQASRTTAVPPNFFTPPSTTTPGLGNTPTRIVRQ